jgi:hypothetical protein
MTLNSDTLLLALGILGRATKIEMILVAKASKEGNITSRYRRCFRVQTLPMQMSHKQCEPCALQWKGSNHKQSARWHYVSQLKVSAFYIW